MSASTLSTGRELARGVMFSVQDATGRYPRPRNIWPTVIGMTLYALVAISLIVFTAVQVTR